MVGRDELLKIIRTKGPVLPVQVAKEVETSILFASAMLSELVSAKILKVSSVKIGGSPLYYLPEQKSRLQEFSKHLAQKEKEAYELLKSRKVLRESEQVPPIKVALRNIKDYAWPLSATVNNSKEIFWRWYLTTNEEAAEIIKERMGIKKEKPKVEEEKKDMLESTKSAEANNDAAQKSGEDAGKKELSKDSAGAAAQSGKAMPEQEQAAKKKPEPAREKEKPEQEQRNLQKEEVQQKIAKSPEEEQNIKREPAKSNENREEAGFAEEMLSYLGKNNIKVLQKETIRKNEIDFIVELQSAVGNLRYYCKTKSKQRIGEGDLSSAYVQGQLRKLPVLFLSYGEPTKRAREMLSNEFKNMVFKKIRRD